MRPLVPLALVLALALAGCSKQAAVESGLVGAGLPPPLAACMSREMAKRLTVAQLRKLSRADTGDGKAPDRLTPADYVERAALVGDPEVVAVTGLAAAYCSQAR